MRRLYSMETDRSYTSEIIRVEGDANCALQAVGLGAETDSVLIVSETVHALHSSVLDEYYRGTHEIFVLPGGEERKNLSAVEAVATWLGGVGLDRGGCVIAVGGGVLLDIVGLAASLYRRGTRLVKVGTTLLAQCDASIGAKCAVNLGPHKNLLGAFHAPIGSLIDQRFLSTLGDEQVRVGLAEIAKLAIIRDRDLFEMLEDRSGALYDDIVNQSRPASAIIDRAVSSMAAELQPNLYERNLKRSVDFGHSLSPKLEAATAYKLLHGDAVAIDMMCMSIESRRQGLLSERNLDRIVALYGALGLPAEHPLLDDPGFIVSALRDTAKHRGGNLHLPMPIDIGSHTFVEQAFGIS